MEATVEITPPKKWYKVLRDGASCHGGNLKWSMPMDGMPGKFHDTTGKLSMCLNGIHVTDQPARWWVVGASCFEVECQGEELEYDPSSFKKAVRAARLVRTIEENELRAMGVFISGNAGLIEKFAHLSGNATAELYGNATAELSGNATAELYGNATAKLYGNATAKLYDNATAKLYDNATAELYDNATAELSGNATAKLSGNATAINWSKTTKITVAMNGAVVDRSDYSTPKLIIADKV